MVCDKTTQDYPKANVGFFLWIHRNRIFFILIYLFTLTGFWQINTFWRLASSNKWQPEINATEYVTVLSGQSFFISLQSMELQIAWKWHGSTVWGEYVNFSLSRLSMPKKDNATTTGIVAGFFRQRDYEKFRRRCLRRTIHLSAYS